MLVRKVWHQERHNIIVCQWQMSPRCCRHYHFVANFFKGNLEITSYISSYNKLLARITFDSTDEGKIYIYESLSTLAVGASIFSYISHWHSASIFLSCWTHLKLGSLFIYYTFEPFCTGYHKIKHFACERDIFVREIPRLKHISSRSISLKSFEYPRFKHFSIHPNSRKCSEPGYKTLFNNKSLKMDIRRFWGRLNGSKYVLYVGFLAQIDLSYKRNVIFYGPAVLKKLY